MRRVQIIKDAAYDHQFDINWLIHGFKDRFRYEQSPIHAPDSVIVDEFIAVILDEHGGLIDQERRQ